MGRQVYRSGEEPRCDRKQGLFRCRRIDLRAKKHQTYTTYDATKSGEILLGHALTDLYLGIVPVECNSIHKTLVTMSSPEESALEFAMSF